VRCTSVFDQVRFSDQPANAPARAVEVLARRADGDGEFFDLGGERGDPCERRVEESVVHFVAEDYDVVLYAERADAFELRAAEDFADRVVTATTSANVLP